MFNVGSHFLRRSIIASCGIILVLTHNLLGYVASSDHWTKNRTVVMHLSLGGPRTLQDGFTSFNQSAADALNIWNQYLVHMKFSPVVNSPLPPADSDADNSAFFSSTVYGDTFGNHVLAITLTSTRGSTVTETDVLFNSAINWNSYRGPQQLPTDFHRVALHEFGHALGLDHPDDAGQNVEAIMNSIVGDLDALTQDDIAGAHSIYDTGPAFLSTTAAPNLLNLSTRALVGTGEKVLIGGFIIQGSQGTSVILRGIGHSLAARGLSNPLNDPVIELRTANGTLVAQNDDWVDGPDAETIASYHLDPSNSRESALVQALGPGNYTVILHAYDNGDGDLTGTGLVELFDLHTNSGRAGNIASRGQVLTGDDVMIAGFIIGGSNPKEVVIRGRGPSLAGAVHTNLLPDPVIELHDGSGNLIASNDNWQTDSNAGRVQTLNLNPPQPVEAALDRTLSPGAYTAIMRGATSATGVGLIEVYDASPIP